jgi:hypothetical protein
MVPIKAKIINQRMALIIHESACSRIILSIKPSEVFVYKSFHLIKGQRKSQANSTGL